jgi:hypothetical protein
MSVEVFSVLFCCGAVLRGRLVFGRKLVVSDFLRVGLKDFVCYASVEVSSIGGKLFHTFGLVELSSM